MDQILDLMLESGRKVTLDRSKNTLGDGVEGSVVAISNSPLCVKVYKENPEKDDPFHHAKLNHLRKKKLLNIVMPIEKAFDVYGDYVGWVSEIAPGQSAFDLYNNRAFESLDTYEVLRLTHCLVETVANCHERKGSPTYYVMGDMLKWQNVIIENVDQLRFVDLLSINIFQFSITGLLEDATNLLSTRGLTAPERLVRFIRSSGKRSYLQNGCGKNEKGVCGHASKKIPNC